MDNDKFQELVIEQLAKLIEGQEQLCQSQVRLENELTDKICGLYDFREVQNDVNNQILSALKRIENKVESHDIQIHVLDKTKSNKSKIK